MPISFLLSSITFPLLFIHIINYQYVFYKNRPFPIDTESRQISFGNGTNSSEFNDTDIINQCVNASIANLICDSINNKEECDFDGGDCCKETCLSNCNLQGLTGEDCLCGSAKYNCKSTTAPCNNCVNGYCEENMNNCFSETEFIKLSIQSCSWNTFTQGNTNTSDYYCGTDPGRNIIHYSTSPNYHFSGCGIEKWNCTLNPCCEVVLINQDTYENCNDIPANRFVWDSTRNSYILKFISCISYYSKCFRENAEVRGECCQCYEGWGGPHCDVPLCKQCVNGVCVDENTCKCFDNYEGEGCKQPICSKCVNGVCIEPEVCECYYGYTGNHCEDVESHPLCVHGHFIQGDWCQCDPGYEGRLCEIKICELDCELCDDEGNCFLLLENKCDSIHPNCIKCDYIDSNVLCTECSGNYIIESGNCIKISEVYPNCNKGNSLKCTECISPYRYNEGTETCESNGIIELSQEYYSIFDDEEKIEISFFRYYGTDGQCSVNVDIFPHSLAFNFKFNTINRMGLFSDIWVFEPGEDEKIIKLPIFKGRYESEESIYQFNIEIFNPQGGCIIGDIDKSKIEIYDSENDAQDYWVYSEATSTAITGTVIIDSTHEIYSNIPSITLTVSFDSSVEQNKYFILFTWNQRDSIYYHIEPIPANPVVSHQFITEMTSTKIQNGENILFFTVCKTEETLMNFYFYNHCGFTELSEPFIKRSVKNIFIDDYYIKQQKTYYSMEWIFYIDKPSTVNNKLFIQIEIPVRDEIILIINKNKILETSDERNSWYNTIIFLYLIDLNNYDDSTFIEVVIRYIHLLGIGKIKVEYSWDNVSFKPIDEDNDLILSKYYCSHVGDFYRLKKY